MPTSDERREVAARLREAWPEAGGMEEVWEVLDPILGTYEGPDTYRAWEQTFNRLADLIDPTCHNTLPQNWGTFECSECGEVVEDGEDYYVSGTWNFCPGCGAKVVSDDGD